MLEYRTLFDGPRFAQELHIVGCGGVGSHAARIAGKEGFPNIHLWDGDIVEAKNTSNQWFDEACDIGEYKTDALTRKLSRWTKAVSHPEYIDGARPLSGVVCLATDSMESRKLVCESTVWRRTGVSLLVEARMDAEYVFIQVVDPHSEVHIARWTRNWYPHSETDNRTAGCAGGATAVGIMASIAADLMIAQVIRYAAILEGRDDTLDNHIEFILRPLRVITKRW